MLLKLIQVLVMLKFLNSFNPEFHLEDTESAIKNMLKKY